MEVRTSKIRTSKQKMAADLSNSVVCDFCGFEQSLLDACDPVQSCPQCGSVLSEEQVFNYEAPVSFVSRTNFSLTKGSTLPHSFQTQQNYEARQWQQKIRASQAELQKLELKRLLLNFCQKLQVSKEITQQIQDFLLEKANPVFLYMKKKVRLVGACIYIISRDNKLPITLKQIAVASSCTVFELGNVVKLIDKTFNLHRTPVTVESLITTACSDLPNGKECEELAQSLCHRSRESMLLNGSPLPQAIAHCVLASLAVNKGTSQREEIKKLCLKMSQVSEKTVLQCVRLLKNHIITLLQAIPWVNMKYVKFSNIHYYIKDVIKYEQNCGKFPAKLAVPQWCHKRESEIQSRKVKIQNALERIRLRQSPATCATPGNEDGLANSVTTELHTAASSYTLASEGEVSAELNTSVSINALPHTESTALNNSVTASRVLDEEDKVIEELLEMGCSAEQLQEGYYDNLRSTSSPISHEIQESEIESYMRKPDEINELKRVTEEDSDVDSSMGTPKKKHRRFVKCRTKPKNVLL